MCIYLHNVILMFNFLISSGLWFFKIKVCTGVIQAKSNSSHYIYCIVSVFSYNQTTRNYWLLSLITNDKRTDISPLTCSLCTKKNLIHCAENFTFLVVPEPEDNYRHLIFMASLFHKKPLV
jgi:hypothetical protein